MTSQENTQKKPELLKTYSQPSIIYEIELETKAGSPLGIVDPLDIIEP